MNWTEEDRARHRAIRERFQRERPSIQQMVASGEIDPPVPFNQYLAARAALADMKKARETAGLSLADVAERSGIDKATLTRLENGVHDNPTISTLMRYAAAVGKRLTWAIEDAPAAAG